MILRTSYILMLLGVLALSLSGCEEDRQSRTAGKLNLRISASGAVTDVTTRSGDEDVPDIKDFSMVMLQDGKVQSSWDKLSDYDEDTTFPIGTYTMRAFYGDMEKEGFASPYYEGSADVVISGGSTTEVEATCKLANTKITVEYTDDFKSYFKTYSTAVKSELGSEVTFASDEIRAAYVKPGRISVKSTFVKVSGSLSSTTVEVATIDEALPQHHYHLLMDVDAGNSTLSIVFDRVTEEKPIALDISDKALNIKAPYFTLTGFEKISNDNNQWDGNLIEASKLSVLLTAVGGFKKCILKTSSSKLTDWPTEGIDLAELTEENKAILTKSGLKLTGFGENKDQMAIIDFTGVVPHLGITDENSTHLFYLQATSSYGKQSEGYVLNITTPKAFMLLPTEPVLMKSTEITIPVKLKSGNSQNIKLYYKYYGVMTLINKTTITPSDKEGYYNIKAIGIDMGFVAKDFQAEYNGVKSGVVTVAVIVPKYNIKLEATDVWSYSAEMTVVPEKREDLSNIMSAIEPYISENGSTWTKTENMMIDAITGKVTIKGLKAGTAYYFRTTCDDGGVFSEAIKQNTESNSQIPNCNFEHWDGAITYNNIPNGGKIAHYKYDFLGNCTSYTDAPLVSIFCEKPTDWFSTNSLTVPNGADPRNSWYMVPSVFKISDSGHTTAVAVKNVAWNNRGDAVSDNSAYNYIGTSGNAVQPPNNFKRSAGKVYLGSLNGDNRDIGISFGSRPKQITFSYKYVPKTSGDNTGGTINFTLESSSGTVLAKFDRELSSPVWTKETIDIPYQLTTAKTARLKVMFTSSTHWSYSQDEENRDIKTTSETNNSDDALKVSVGSELYIDDIELIFK